MIKQLNEREQAIFDSKSIEELQEMVRRADMIMNSQPWPEDEMRGFMKAKIKTLDQITKRLEVKC